jgi:protein-tyrosine phosphatase
MPPKKFSIKNLEKISKDSTSVPLTPSSSSQFPGTFNPHSSQFPGTFNQHSMQFELNQSSASDVFLNSSITSGSFTYTPGFLSPNSISQQPQFQHQPQPQPQPQINRPFEASPVEQFMKNGKKSVIWIGGKFYANSLENLQNDEITAILNMASECHPEPNVLKNIKHYKKIPLRDNIDQSFLDVIEEAYTFIDNCVCRGNSILVHCQEGISRSVSIVIAFLMMKKIRSSFSSLFDNNPCVDGSNAPLYFDMLEKIQKKRYAAFPNWGFCLQLHKLEKQLTSFVRSGNCAKILNLSTYEERLTILDDAKNKSDHLNCNDPDITDDDYKNYVDDLLYDKICCVSFIIDMNQNWSNCEETEEPEPLVSH